MTKNIQIISKVVKIIKRPKLKNLNSGNVCIYDREREAIGPNDTAIIEVQELDGTVVRTRTYKGQAFHDALRKREKLSKSGHRIKFTTIEC